MVPQHQQIHLIACENVYVYVPIGNPVHSYTCLNTPVIRFQVISRRLEGPFSIKQQVRPFLSPMTLSDRERLNDNRRTLYISLKDGFAFLTNIIENNILPDFR